MPTSCAEQPGPRFQQAKKVNRARKINQSGSQRVDRAIGIGRMGQRFEQGGKHRLERRMRRFAARARAPGRRFQPSIRSGQLRRIGKAELRQPGGKRAAFREAHRRRRSTSGSSSSAS